MGNIGKATEPRSINNQWQPTQVTDIYRFSPYYIRFLWPNFICQHKSITETIVKQRPLAFVLFKFQAGEACLSAIFIMVNSYAIQDTRLFHILTSLVHVGPLNILTTVAVSLAMNCEHI